MKLLLTSGGINNPSIEAALVDLRKALPAGMSEPRILFRQSDFIEASIHNVSAALRDGDDAVIIPAEDGGYVLIGLREPQPALFCAMRWSVPTVLAETRRRLARCSLRARELARLWDVDVPDDLSRLSQPGFEDLVAGVNKRVPCAHSGDPEDMGGGGLQP